MGIVKARISVSLDGYIAGPNIGPGNPLGDHGHRVHDWVYGLAAWRQQQGREGGAVTRDSEIVAGSNANIGATVMGYRMFATGEEPWGEEPPFHCPVFVLSREPREPLVRIGTTFTFLPDGIDRAVELARAEAGDQDVAIAGGAATLGLALRAGLLDELLIHVAPLMLGAGTRLFDGPGLEGVRLEPIGAEHSANVSHLRYRVVR